MCEQRTLSHQMLPPTTVASTTTVAPTTTTTPRRVLKPEDIIKISKIQTNKSIVFITIDDGQD